MGVFLKYPKIQKTNFLINIHTRLINIHNKLINIHTRLINNHIRLIKSTPDLKIKKQKYFVKFIFIIFIFHPEGRYEFGCSIKRASYKRASHKTASATKELVTKQLVTTELVPKESWCHKIASLKRTRYKRAKILKRKKL